jgi:hypothetical protein
MPHLLGGYLPYGIPDAVPFDFFHARVFVVTGVAGDHPVHDALPPQDAGDLARVDPLDSRDAVRPEILLQRPLTAEIAPARRKVPHDEGPRPGFGRFGVLVVHAVVPDQRIGHDDALPGIGGVGQHLLVPRHGGIKNHFAHGFFRRAHAWSFKDPALFKNDKCFHLLP